MANKVANGMQMTMAWHVNDLKVSHKQLKVLEAFSKQVNDEFSKEAPITQTYGKRHEYLGMILDYTMPERWIFP